MPYILISYSSFFLLLLNHLHNFFSFSRFERSSFQSLSDLSTTIPIYLNFSIIPSSLSITKINMTLFLKTCLISSLCLFWSTSLQHLDMQCFVMEIYGKVNCMPRWPINHCIFFCIPHQHTFPLFKSMPRSWYDTMMSSCSALPSHDGYV